MRPTSVARWATPASAACGRISAAGVGAAVKILRSVQQAKNFGHRKRREAITRRIPPSTISIQKAAQRRLFNMVAVLLVIAVRIWGYLICQPSQIIHTGIKCYRNSFALLKGVISFSALNLRVVTLVYSSKHLHLNLR